MEALYDLETRLLQAVTKGNNQQAVPLLDHALSELRILVRNHPDVTDDAEFRRLYRSFISEYRTIHGHELVDSTAARGKIFDLRSALFRKLGDEAGTAGSEAREIAGTAVPMPNNRPVRKSVRFLTEERPEVLETWEKRAETYFPMVEHILVEEEVPTELKYLALVESGLNPRAKSWAGAVGMWQFIASTGRESGLRIDRRIDERRDPEKATRAAARHLRDLYEEFGDWHLAMAAYNCGVACVKRALRRSSGSTFWEVYGSLPRETRGYIPMFVATAQIFVSRDMQEEGGYAFGEVTVEGPLRLRTVSREGGVSLRKLEKLNLELRKGRVPPEPYRLKVPLKISGKLVRGSTQNPAMRTHTVQQGDALTEIANRYDSSVRAIVDANQLQSTTIHPGRRLKIPGSDSELRIASNSVRRVDYSRSDPVVTSNIDLADDQEEQSASRPSPPVTEANLERRSSARERSQAPHSKPDGQEVHVVRPGQSLWEISRQYDVSIPQIAWTNQLKSPHLQPGQRLSIDPDREWPSSITVRVRFGDTLSDLSRTYGVSAGDIREWNSLGSNRIYAGQKLQMYAPGNKRVHTVKRGQTLSEIAQRYGVSASKLRRWNGLTSSVIYPGQELVVQKNSN
jgi:membrane-bound lytic murein transglycosylase D